MFASDLGIILEFTSVVLGCPPSTSVLLPVYEELAGLSEEEVEQVSVAKILAFEVNTWFKHAQAIKTYVRFCELRQCSTYPVNVGVLNLCLLSLSQKGKSKGVIESVVKAVSFASIFLDVG